MCFFQALIQKAHTFAVHFGSENVSFANFADHGRNYLRPGGLVKHFYSVKVEKHDFSVKAEVDGSVFGHFYTVKVKSLDTDAKNCLNSKRKSGSDFRAISRNIRQI